MARHVLNLTYLVTWASFLLFPGMCQTCDNRSIFQHLNHLLLVNCRAHQDWKCTRRVSSCTWRYCHGKSERKQPFHHYRTRRWSQKLDLFSRGCWTSDSRSHLVKGTKRNFNIFKWIRFMTIISTHKFRTEFCLMAKSWLSSRCKWAVLHPCAPP